MGNDNKKPHKIVDLTHWRTFMAKQQQAPRCRSEQKREKGNTLLPSSLTVWLHTAMMTLPADDKCVLVRRSRNSSNI